MTRFLFPQTACPPIICVIFCRMPPHAPFYFPVPILCTVVKRQGGKLKQDMITVGYFSKFGGVW